MSDNPDLQKQHAWITTRRPCHLAAGSFHLGGPNGKHIAGEDTLFESIIVEQSGTEIASNCRYFGKVHVIRGGRQAYGGQPHEDTVCDFKVDPRQGFWISYCLANMSKGTVESVKELHRAVLERTAPTTVGTDHITWDRVAEALRAGIILSNDPTTITTDPQAFANVVAGFRATQNLIWANMDGPVAFGRFYIDDPTRMKLNQSETEFRSLLRSQRLTGESDYEVDFRIKILPDHEWRSG